MSDMSHIGVVGGGAWGTALACLARRAGRRVTLWSRDPSVSAAIARDRSNPVYLPDFPLDGGIEAAADLADLGACDAILLVCPAQAVRELAARLAGTAPVVICAKGIEASSGLLMPEVLAEVLPGRPIAMLSGPSFAEETIRGLPTAVSIATADHALGETLAGALAAGAFRPYWTDDVLGVALGGAVKNVLAIAAGVVEGRGLGHNAAAALITRGFAEMARLGQAMGAKLETLTGLERARRSGADLPRPLVAQPLPGAGPGQGHQARRLPGRPPPGRRRRGDGAGGAGARGAIQNRDADLCRRRCYPAWRRRPRRGDPRAAGAPAAARRKMNVGGA